MILPTKHITVDDSLIGLGALLLSHLDQPATVSVLWQEVRELPQIATFERFTLTLDLLYLMNVIEYRDGDIRRVSA